jgi:16S rRNA (guanine966-N2)-methyltransferase
MRIIAGSLRGKILVAPDGQATRPTAQRLRQTLFDMLMHAPWGGRALIEGASVLDAFAGTGALGLEALSRGAEDATFIETDRLALAALRANVASCKLGDRARILAADTLRPPPGTGQTIVFLDPPYERGLLPLAVGALRKAGWIVPSTLLVSESGRLETGVHEDLILAQKVQGGTKMIVWREP